MKRKRRYLLVEFLEDRQLLTTTTLDVQVAASSDDAEERPSGSVTLTSSDLEMTQDKTNQQIVGMRFTGLNIPPAASIQDAYLQFQADETGSDPTSLAIFGQAIDNAPTFTSTYGDIAGRATTTASVSWSPAPWNTRGEAGPAQQTPNIAAVIQEIVNRPGWSNGNSLAIIVTGTGARTAESYNGSPSAAPLLHVEYETGNPTGNQTPTTSGIANVNVNTDAPDTVIDLFAAFDDAEDPDPALAYTIENNTNSSLFTSTTINGAQGTMTLDYAPATDGTADITVRATDTGSPPLFVETSFTVTIDPGNPGGTGTIEVRVNAGDDDAEEKSTGSVKLTSSDLELTVDKSNQQVVGLRFNSLNLPQGATIQNAYLQFQADETGSDPTTLVIHGQATDNAPNFASTTGNVTSRTTTNASVPWSPAPWNKGDAGSAQQTPNVASVIQEVVSRPGWSAGNSLAIIVTGTGKRTAESFDGVPSAAPLLHVEYVTGNLTPTTSGIADVNVNTDAPDTVINLFAAFDDFEDPDPALIYTIENHTNPSLFTSTTIDGVLGTLTLDYAPAINGTADITIRATDTGTPPLFVETTFTVTVAPVNQPPTTTGIADVFVAEDAGNTVIDLFAAFDDPEGPDSLTYTVEANTNSALFTSTSIDGALDSLTLNYAPDANGSADITVRGTDAGIPVLFVETTFTVDISEVNDTPILSSGSVDDLTVAQNSPPTPLGLAGLGYGPGGGADENGQTLSYSVTSVPLPTLGDVVLSDGSTVVTPGAYTLAQIQGMQFKAAPNIFGSSDTFSFTVTDNGTTNGVADFKTLPQSLLIDVVEDITPSVLDIRVAARSDDAEERFSGVVKYVSKDLDLVDDPTQSGVQQTVGMRFNGLAIPQGAVITSAYVQFEASASDDDVTTLQFHGEDTDNAATFDTTDFNVTSRPVTNATVAWSPPDWTTAGEAGANQQTPNIAPVIQEIVDRSGWVAGNSMALIITGFGERAAVSYDGDVVNGTNGAPLLHVEYTDQSPAMAPLAGSPPSAAEPIDEGQPSPNVDEAGLSYSLNSETVEPLAGLTYEVADLVGDRLGRANPFLALAGSLASERVDIVLHERGQLLGSEHTESTSWMDATLPLVTGRFPVDPSELLPGESLEVELSVSQVDEFYELLDLSKRRFAF